jgi:DNA-binding response OmpR family regulator
MTKMDKKRILVVDDEKDFVAMLKLRLEANGYEVIPAFDGVQGVAFAKRKKPDLILLDVMMPAGGGYLVCERLKMFSDTWSIPIIFLTAKSQPEDEAKAYSVGAKYYLTKPYEPKVLLAMVKRALEPSEELDLE